MALTACKGVAAGHRGRNNVVDNAADDAVTATLHFRRHNLYRGCPQVGHQLLDAAVTVVVVRKHPAQLREINQQLNATVRYFAAAFGYIQNGFHNIGVSLPESAGYAASTKARVHPLADKLPRPLTGLVDHQSGL